MKVYRKYIVAPERCAWTEVEALSPEIAYRAFCSIFNPNRKIAVIDAETGETHIYKNRECICGGNEEMMNWYMTTYWDDRENDYDLCRSDEEAVNCILSNSVGVCEIYRCNDDECLTPAKLLWH